MKTNYKDPKKSSGRWCLLFQSWVPTWAYSLVDSSQVSTFLISILLIVYGSFRSLNMDLENQDKDKDGNAMSQGTFNTNASNNSIQTIDSTQALFLPIGASVSLLVMFFFFDSVQVVFTICTAVLATIAFAFLLLPMCQYLTRPCSPQNKISFGCCGRFTAAELLSFSLSVMLVLIWVLTGHWLLMDGKALHSSPGAASPPPGLAGRGGVGQQHLPLHIPFLT
ncbi:signal peptide peptidase-like 3 isoform X1 [Polyodon spathula]|uniref:signal peptide peptidase-like 3 isoform X1 n=1 Tax=Polyodon spathula TaxID=7913 RepID=UPI001B7E93FB|nr:signal peptide peptidase-like 3 isoform X1 [Polyodon spathula]